MVLVYFVGLKGTISLKNIQSRAVELYYTEILVERYAHIQWTSEAIEIYPHMLQTMPTVEVHSLNFSPTVLCACLQKRPWP